MGCRHRTAGVPYNSINTTLCLMLTRAGMRDVVCHQLAAHFCWPWLVQQSAGLSWVALHWTWLLLQAFMQMLIHHLMARGGGGKKWRCWTPGACLTGLLSPCAAAVKQHATPCRCSYLVQR